VNEAIIISIPHKLGKEEALRRIKLRRIKPVLAKASKSFPVLSVEEKVWSGDRMDFRVRALGQVAAGNVRVFDDSVRRQCAGRRVGWRVARGNATIQHMRRGGRQQRWKARNLDLPLPPKGAYKPSILARSAKSLAPAMDASYSGYSGRNFERHSARSDFRP
jgi:hypothetical protein